MKERITLFGRLGLFWIIYFECCRALFMIYHWHHTILLSFTDIATVFLLGLRMDLAMSGYWLILSGLLLSIPFLPSSVIYYSQNILTAFFLLISSAIVIVDLDLYTHW